MTDKTGSRHLPTASFAESTRSVPGSTSTGSGGTLDGGSATFGLTAALGIERGPVPADDPADDPLTGSSVGDVRLGPRIGQGGMGRVYEGYDERLHRHVAVKVIRPGLIETQAMRRFDTEARVLAAFDHPGIARIHSCGTCRLQGEDVPFFVMEYVPNARPITDYAALHGLTRSQRLGLFQQVCDAVAHGHDAGVVHRDLKPANILVDANRGPHEARPKVIDFGVAKTTGADVERTAGLTDDGRLVGTPSTMSPEQFAGNSNAIDVRADVYALGIVLFDLLTGRLPYELASKKIHEIARIVSEEEPRSLASIDHTIHRDLAVIAAKCLEKDPRHRYASARELGDDIRRHLAGEPISAEPPSALVAIRRFSRRHRAVAVSAAAVAASLVFSLVAVSAFYRQALIKRDEAEDARAKAQVAEREALDQKQDTEKVLKFLEDSLGVPVVAAAQQPASMEESLRAAAKRLDRHFGAYLIPRDAVVKARLLTTIGGSLRALGRPIEALGLLNRAATLLARRGGPEDMVDAQCHNELAAARIHCGDYLGAATASRHAGQICERVLGPSAFNTVLTRNQLALALTGLADYDEAERLLEEAEAVIVRDFGPHDPTLATILSNRGDLLRRQGRLTEAEALHRQAIAVLDRDGSDGARGEMATLLNNLGEVCRLGGRPEEAAEHHLRALEIQKDVLPAEHYEFSGSLSKLGKVRLAEGRPDLAEPLFREALRLRQQAGLESHPETAVILLGLASCEARAGRTAEAVALVERATALRESHLGPDHPDTRAARAECENLRSASQPPKESSHASAAN